MKNQQVQASHCPTCKGKGSILDTLGPPVPPDATLEEAADWPFVSLIFVVCQTCNGERFVEEFGDRARHL